MATKDLPTVLGTTTFDANGDAVGGSISGYKVETSLAAGLPAHPVGQGVALPTAV